MMERHSLIVNFITPTIKAAVDSILFHSDSREKRYSDTDVENALVLLKDFFMENGYAEYFEIAKIQYPYLKEWMK
jgi:hypothetical protein